MADPGHLEPRAWVWLTSRGCVPSTVTGRRCSTEQSVRGHPPEVTGCTGRARAPAAAPSHPPFLPHDVLLLNRALFLLVRLRNLNY